MDYSYEYGYDISEAQIMEFLQEFGPALLGGLIVFLLVMLILAIVAYVFTALGFYTVAKRRGIKNPWLAWIPVADLWILGSISDQYQYVVKGKITNRRTILLVLSLVSFGVSFIVSFVTELLAAFAVSSSGADAMLGISALVSVATTIVSFVCAVYQYIALYDYYTSCSPANNVLFLVLGIIFSFLQPFFVFGVRNKDGGMPPRKTAPAAPRYMPAQPAHAPAEPPYAPAAPRYDTEYVQPEPVQPVPAQPEPEYARPEYEQPKPEEFFRPAEEITRREPEVDPWDRPDHS